MQIILFPPIEQKNEISGDYTDGEVTIAYGMHDDGSFNPALKWRNSRREEYSDTITSDDFRYVGCTAKVDTSKKRLDTTVTCFWREKNKKNCLIGGNDST